MDEAQGDRGRAEVDRMALKAAARHSAAHKPTRASARADSRSGSHAASASAKAVGRRHIHICPAWSAPALRPAAAAHHASSRQPFLQLRRSGLSGEIRATTSASSRHQPRSARANASPIRTRRFPCRFSIRQSIALPKISVSPESPAMPGRPRGHSGTISIAGHVHLLLRLHVEAVRALRMVRIDTNDAPFDCVFARAQWCDGTDNSCPSALTCGARRSAFPDRRHQAPAANRRVSRSERRTLIVTWAGSHRNRRSRGGVFVLGKGMRRRGAPYSH